MTSFVLQLPELQHVIDLPKINLSDEEQLAFARTLGDDASTRARRGSTRSPSTRRSRPRRIICAARSCGTSTAGPTTFPRAARSSAAGCSRPSAARPSSPTPMRPGTSFPRRRRRRSPGSRPSTRWRRPSATSSPTPRRRCVRTGRATPRNCTRWSGRIVPGASRCCWAAAPTGSTAWTRTRAARSSPTPGLGHPAEVRLSPRVAGGRHAHLGQLRLAAPRGAYPADSGRLMHRVTLVGEEAIA